MATHKPAFSLAPRPLWRKGDESTASLGIANNTCVSAIKNHSRNDEVIPSLVTRHKSRSIAFSVQSASLATLSMRWQIPTGVCCLLPLALAVLVACLIPRHINKALSGGIKDQIVWSEDSPSDTYARYSRDDHPDDPLVQTDFYLLNVTNLEAVKAGSKPVLQQLGPYLYKKHTVKQNIWFDSRGRVTFTRDEFYTELPSNSLFPSLDDVVTTVNLPLLGALAKAHSFFGRFVALQLLLEVLASFHDPNVDGLFMKRTVRELLWGYDDPLLQKLHILLPAIVPSARFQLVPNTTASSIHPNRRDIVNTGNFLPPPPPSPFLQVLSHPSTLITKVEHQGATPRTLTLLKSRTPAVHVASDLH